MPMLDSCMSVVITTQFVYMNSSIIFYRTLGLSNLISDRAGRERVPTGGDLFDS